MVDADYTGQLGGEGRRNTRIPQLHYLPVTENGLKICNYYYYYYDFDQCSGSMTFWGGSGSCYFLH
jgi:hypothetical protein